MVLQRRMQGTPKMNILPHGRTAHRHPRPRCCRLCIGTRTPPTLAIFNQLRLVTLFRSSTRKRRHLVSDRVCVGASVIYVADAIECRPSCFGFYRIHDANFQPHNCRFGPF